MNDQNRRQAYTVDAFGVVTMQLRLTDPRTGGWVTIEFEMSPTFVEEMMSAQHEAMYQHPVMVDLDTLPRIPPPQSIRRVIDPDGVERGVSRMTRIASRKDES